MLAALDLRQSEVKESKCSRYCKLKVDIGEYARTNVQSGLHELLYSYLDICKVYLWSEAVITDKILKLYCWHYIS